MDLGRGRCVRARGVDAAAFLAPSPDGRHVYVASTNDGPIAVFRRVGPRGTLRQLPGREGCVHATGAGKCARGRALDVLGSVTVSPDGRNVYVAAAGAGGGVAIFRRDARSGALTQLPGVSGCVAEDTPGCASARGLANESAVAVSSDGRFAYVASESKFVNPGGVAIFSRDSATGALTQLDGGAGCLTPAGAGGCGRLRGLSEGVASAALSPDGRNLYAGSPGQAGGPDAVAAFARDVTTGTLTQLEGTAGCVSAGGTHGCAPARGLASDPDAKTAPQDLQVAISSDGRHVYAGAHAAIAIFSRHNESGALVQSPGRRACVATGRREGCSIARGRPSAMVVLSPDGHNAYALGDDGITNFSRDARTGALRQLRGPRGCISQRTRGCARGRALGLPSGLAITPDGANVYVASFGSGAVALFRRHMG